MLERLRRRAFDAVGHLRGRPHVALERLPRPTLHDGKGGLVGGLYAQVLDGRAHEPVQGVGERRFLGFASGVSGLALAPGGLRFSGVPRGFIRCSQPVPLQSTLKHG